MIACRLFKDRLKVATVLNSYTYIHDGPEPSMPSLGPNYTMKSIREEDFNIMSRNMKSAFIENQTAMGDLFRLLPSIAIYYNQSNQQQLDISDKNHVDLTSKPQNNEPNKVHDRSPDHEKNKDESLPKPKMTFGEKDISFSNQRETVNKNMLKNENDFASEEEENDVGFVGKEVPVAWSSLKHVGDIGNTFTVEEHRRKGLAEATLVGLTRIVKSYGSVPLVNVRHDNDASAHLVTKVGFRRRCKSKLLVYYSESDETEVSDILALRE